MEEQATTFGKMIRIRIIKTYWAYTVVGQEIDLWCRCGDISVVARHPLASPNVHWRLTARTGFTSFKFTQDINSDRNWNTSRIFIIIYCPSQSQQKGVPCFICSVPAFLRYTLFPTHSLYPSQAHIKIRPTSLMLSNQPIGQMTTMWLWYCGHLYTFSTIKTGHY